MGSRLHPLPDLLELWLWQKERAGQDGSKLWKVGRGGCVRRPKAGGIQALERWRFPATEAGPRGSQERRGETHTESGDQRTTDETGAGSWEERDQRETDQGAGDLHTLQSPETSLSSETSFCSLWCSEPSLMQAAWLLGALVVYPSSWASVMEFGEPRGSGRGDALAPRRRSGRGRP